MIKGITHVAYSVTDIDKALEFYCGALGFKRTFDLNDATGKPFIFYTKINGTQFFELFYNDTDHGEQKFTMKDVYNYGYHHLSLYVDNIYEVQNKLLQGNYTVYEKIYRDNFDNNLKFWGADPDGNPIEFMQLVPDCPQLTKGLK